MVEHEELTGVVTTTMSDKIREAFRVWWPKCVDAHVSSYRPAEEAFAAGWQAALAQAVPIKHDRAEAERCLFVLREIASMDAEDIAGDNIDLRFEDADGRDTGCDASIVEYAQRAADVIEKLLAAGPAAPIAQDHFPRVSILKDATVCYAAGAGVKD